MQFSLRSVFPVNIENMFSSNVCFVPLHCRLVTFVLFYTLQLNVTYYSISFAWSLYCSNLFQCLRENISTV
jgi:hypothetical protein